jgi:hypothetical protein
LCFACFHGIQGILAIDRFCCGSNEVMMMTTRSSVTKGGLSGPRQRLVEIMQQVNFGRIELEVRSGEPVLQPAPRIVQDLKLGGGENGPRAELTHEDFVLKTQVIEMFDYLSRLGDGSMATIHLQHGLPCRLTIEQPA